MTTWISAENINADHNRSTVLHITSSDLSTQNCGWIFYLHYFHVVWCSIWCQCLRIPWRKGMFLQTVDGLTHICLHLETHNTLGRWRARDHKSWHGSVSVDRQKAVVPNTRKLQDLFHESLAWRSTVVTRLLLPPSVQEIHWFYLNQTILEGIDAVTCFNWAYNNNCNRL